MLVVFLHSALAAPCTMRWDELAPTLDGADAAWGVSEEAFRGAVAALDQRLPCLVDPLTPVQVARVHRAEGLSAWLDSDFDRARGAFAAARAADPTYSFPAEMVPANNPVRRLYESAEVSPDATLLPRARRATIRLDGADTRARPAERATVFQLVAEDGVAQSAWLPAGAPAPVYARPGDGLRLPLLLGAGACAVGAGVLTGLAWQLAADPPTPTSQEDLEGIGARNHGFVYGAAGLGVGALGVGVTAMLVTRW